MHRYTAAIDAIAIGVGILIPGAMVADPALAPSIATTITSQVSPFDLMVKAKDLPVQICGYMTCGTVGGAVEWTSGDPQIRHGDMAHAEQPGNRPCALPVQPGAAPPLRAGSH